MIRKFRKMVPTSCHDCLVDIFGWESEDPKFPAVGYVTLMSKHVPLYNRRLTTRIKRAWKILRYNEDTADIELNSKAECQAVINVLTEMGEKLWPKQKGKT